MLCIYEKQKQLINLLQKDSKKIIKLCFLFFVFNLLTFAEANAQTGKVSINLKNASVKELFSAIESQTSYRFSYRKAEVDNKKRITVSVKNGELKDLLVRELTKLHLSYIVQDNKIIVTPVTAPRLSNQSNKITGKVVDANSEPIVGATIKEQGTANGTITDIDGNFNFVVSPNAIIEISYIGYQGKQVKTTSEKSMFITLKEDAELLDEVVIVGYGIQKKVNLTGAVSVVDSKTIQNRPITNATQALQGAQGVYVNSAAGAQPGNDAATIRIRGMGTFSGAGNDPLFLIDGVPGTLTDVNPSDIASISVLKDAASASIYGSRAANGVVLVTTKKAEAGQFSVSYNNSFGLQQITYLPDAVWDPILYMKGFDKAYENEGKAPLYADIIEEYKEGMKVDPYTYPATNWFDLYFRDAFIQEHNIRISGGNEHIQTGLSIGYLDQEGVVKFTDAKKVSINFNSTVKYGQFKAGINVSANYRNYNEPHYGISDYMQLAMRALPVMTPYLADGSYGRSWVVTPGQNTFGNMLACKDGENNYKQTRIVSSAFAEYVFPYDIKYNVTLGIRKVDLTRRYFQPATYTYNPKTLEPQKMIANTTAMNTANDDINPSISQTINWSHKFNGKHDISALLGMNYEEFNAWSFSARGQDGYLDNELTEVGLATTFLKPSSSSSKVRLLSYFGRLNYDYADRYLFEMNLRYDGSSRFAKNIVGDSFPLSLQDGASTRNISWKTHKTGCQT